MSQCFSVAGEWLTRFDPKFTSNELFYMDENKIVNVDMMLGVKYPLSVFTHLELDAQVIFISQLFIFINVFIRGFSNG